MNTHASPVQRKAASTAPPGKTKSFFSSGTARDTFFQPRLTVGPVDDVYEREADAVADRVMRMGQQEVLQTKISPVNIQRACSHCEEEEEGVQRKEDNTTELHDALAAAPGGGDEGLSAPGGTEGSTNNRTQHQNAVVQPRCADCEKEESVQRKEAPGGQEAPPIVSEAVSGQGSAMEGQTRNFMENRFGYDFSDVRIHTDSLSARSAQSIQALAYTSGNNIVFNEGQYAPESDSGKRLLAHELTHVVQQNAGVATKRIQRYGPACTPGAENPCRYDLCGDRHAGIAADFNRAIDYTNAVAAALTNTTLDTRTIEALDWYFNDHSAATVATARTRMNCIKLCLQDARARQEYGCHPSHSALAYVCVGSTAICSEVVTNVCLTDNYFGEGNQSRAEILIHECGHRIGLSLGRGNDIYDHTLRFTYLDRDEALMNADSFALFAGAIANGESLALRTSIVGATLPLGGGGVLSGGSPTWYARLNMASVEFQHPVLRFFNPVLGLSLTVIGESDTMGTSGSPLHASASGLLSLTAGFRIGNPRPGSAGGPYVSFWGGPSLAVTLGNAAPGAEAGVALGYRWRWADFSAGATYMYDSTRPEGLRDMVSIGPSLSITFEPIVSSGH